VILKGYLSRLPLTDRITFAKELWAGFFYGIFAGLALPLIPIVARRIGMSPEAITAMVTTQFAGALLGVIAGHFADKGRKMPWATWPNVAARGVLGLLAFAATPVPYLVVVSTFNILLNLSAPAYGSIMRTNYSNEHRGRLMANVRILIVVVSALFSSIAGIVLAADEAIVRWLFPVAALFGVLSSLTFRTIKVRRGPLLPAEPGHKSARASLGVLGKNRLFLLFMALMFLCAFPDKIAVSLEPIWMVDFLHVGYGEASFLLGTVVSLAGILGYWFWARALKRANPFLVLSLVVLLFAGRFYSMALTHATSQLFVMSIISGLTNAGWDLVPLFCIIALSDTSNFSLYLGLNTTLYGVRGLIGPTIGTWLYASGTLSMYRIFWLIASLLATGALSMFLFSRRPAIRNASLPRARSLLPH
jgi:MFS family permease